MNFVDYYMSNVTLFGANWAPRQWALCDGSLISIAANTALFALLGTTYGGDGQNTFALPDLRGRVPVGTGDGPGLQNIELGQMSGTENNTMVSSQMPAHIHSSQVNVSVPVNANASDTDNPEGAFPGIASFNLYSNGPGGGQFMSGLHVNGTLGIAGGSEPIPNMMPYLTLNYIICVEGIFPSRN